MRERAGAAIRNHLRNLIGGWPLLFSVAAKLRPRWRPLAFSGHTDIVIEGFPRSGNTFAVVAFQLAQVRPVHIAHHLHVPSQVLKAVRAGTPSIVLIRPPRDAVASLLVREPGIMPDSALRAYVSFYTKLMPVRRQVVCCTFDELTSNYSKIVSSVNDRFGCSFGLPEDTATYRQSVFTEIERISERLGDDEELRISRPSEMRKAASTKIKAGLTNEPMLNRAEKAYLQFVMFSTDRT